MLILYYIVAEMKVYFCVCQVYCRKPQLIHIYHVIACGWNLLSI